MTHMYFSAGTDGIRTFRHALRAAYRTAISAAQILVFKVVGSFPFVQRYNKYCGPAQPKMGVVTCQSRVQQNMKFYHDLLWDGSGVVMGRRQRPASCKCGHATTDAHLKMRSTLFILCYNQENCN